MKNEEPKNWADLPTDLMCLILLRLSVTEILENAQKVCRSWRYVCKDPSIWRKIDMRILSYNKPVLVNNPEAICRNAVDRSEGGLLEINIGDFGSDSLLTYIAERSSNLRSLRLMCSEITDDGFVQAVVKLPMLEELEVSGISLSGESMKLAGLSCPNLKTLMLNRLFYLSSDDDDHDAIAIAESMPKLRHLQLCGNKLTKTGLNAILDGCPHLEHLDLRQCINLVGNLEKRCFEKIKDLRRHNDSTSADYPFSFETYYFHWSRQLAILKNALPMEEGAYNFDPIVEEAEYYLKLY
ncbi:unnamed protein product [Arabidopsis thaliana]|nr:unnamed protein product [Arabidopsis thaliana]